MRNSDQHASFLAMISRTGHLRRTVVAWISVAMLVLQVFAAAMAPGAASAGTLANALDSDNIVVCTAAGMVVLDHNGQPTQPSADKRAGFCVFCLPLMQGCALTADATSDAAAPGLIVQEVSARAPLAAALIPHPLAGAASPQAPPFC